ncbi:MAG: hypothetical protein M0Z58_00385 [Nitrospiraceae bacterium]|nr:hypothetical protein [Nitrospiraceae bacterium]
MKTGFAIVTAIVFALVILLAGTPVLFAQYGGGTYGGASGGGAGTLPALTGPSSPAVPGGAAQRSTTFTAASQSAAGKICDQVAAKYGMDICKTRKQTGGGNTWYCLCRMLE